MTSIDVVVEERLKRFPGMELNVGLSDPEINTSVRRLGVITGYELLAISGCGVSIKLSPWFGYAVEISCLFQPSRTGNEAYPVFRDFVKELNRSGDYVQVVYTTKFFKPIGIFGRVVQLVYGNGRIFMRPEEKRSLKEVTFSIDTGQHHNFYKQIPRFGFSTKGPVAQLG